MGRQILMRESQSGQATSVWHAMRSSLILRTRERVGTVGTEPTSSMQGSVSAERVMTRTRKKKGKGRRKRASQILNLKNQQSRMPRMNQRRMRLPRKRQKPPKSQPAEPQRPWSTEDLTLTNNKSSFVI